MPLTWTSGVHVHALSWHHEGDGIEDNIREVVEKATRFGCTEPVFKFIEDVQKLMRCHDDDYYFFWITESMDSFFYEMEDALEKGVLPR